MKKLFLIIIFTCVIVSINAQHKTEKYIEKYSKIAVAEMKKYNIPASITLAQGILESGNGESRLAKEGNNHFGIKCHSNWNGKTIIEDDDERGECFRKYDNVEDSFRDHSLFLTERGRYSFLFDLNKKNYKAWAKGLKKAGYATNPKYPDLLIDLIERYDLSRFDKNSNAINKLYFANKYGFPYALGFGLFYINDKIMYTSQVSTSFLYTNTNLGLSYELFNNIYAGFNSGFIYLPAKKQDFIHEISINLSYKITNNEKRYDMLIIETGVQIPLYDIGYRVIPSLCLNYLFN